MEEEDEEMQLDQSTLAILAEFLGEKKREQEKFEKLRQRSEDQKIDISAFTEDW